MRRRLLFRLLASAPPVGDHVPDAELLRRFVASNDSAAFELVVRRHADAVWAACRRMLRCDADAEDAFQATFLALIRKAKAIRTPCVGGWLHRVAVNAALKLKAGRTRGISDGVEPEAHPSAAPGSLEQQELACAVHEELARLPERERLPVVLCDLEGLSHADAATALGWPVGTVSGRLSRARAKLRDRLARRGLAPSAALLPALGAPPHLIPNTLPLAAGAAPPAVASLAEGALAMMKTTTWTWAAVACTCAALAGVGGALALAPGSEKPAPALTDVRVAAENPQPKDKPKVSEENWLPPLTRQVPNDASGLPPSAFPELALPKVDEKDPKRAEKYEEQYAKLCPRLTGSKDLTIEPTDDTLRKLLKARLHQGVLELIRIREVIRIGNWDPRQRFQVIECLTDMQATVFELWGNQPKELIPWLEEFVVEAKTFERFTLIRVRLGTDPLHVLNAATRHRLAVEAALVKAKRRA